MKKKRDWILDIAKQAASGFVIAPGIAKLFKIVGGLNTTASWKAKVLLANSGGKVGAWDAVGYIMVSAASNNIVPIARADEHHMGFDVLQEKYIPLGAPSEDYYPLYIGRNYVYPDDIARLLVVGQRWLSMGGPDLVIESPGKYAGTLKDFIKRAGKVEYGKGEIGPVGQQVITNLEELAKQANQARTNPKLVKGFNKNAADFLEAVGSGPLYFLIANPADTKDGAAAIEMAPDTKLAEQALFGHSGIKNSLHMKIKEAIKDPKAWDADKTRAIFGDLNAALAEFNRLGMI